jgi:hypothetical protein
MRRLEWCGSRIVRGPICWRGSYRSNEMSLVLSVKDVSSSTCSYEEKDRQQHPWLRLCSRTPINTAGVRRQTFVSRIHLWMGSPEASSRLL